MSREVCRATPPHSEDLGIAHPHQVSWKQLASQSRDKGSRNLRRLQGIPCGVDQNPSSGRQLHPEDEVDTEAPRSGRVEICFARTASGRTPAARASCRENVITDEEPGRQPTLETSDGCYLPILDVRPWQACDWKGRLWMQLMQLLDLDPQALILSRIIGHLSLPDKVKFGRTCKAVWRVAEIAIWEKDVGAEALIGLFLPDLVVLDVCNWTVVNRPIRDEDFTSLFWYGRGVRSVRLVDHHRDGSFAPALQGLFPLLMIHPHLAAMFPCLRHVKIVLANGDSHVVRYLPWFLLQFPLIEVYVKIVEDEAADGLPGGVAANAGAGTDVERYVPLTVEQICNYVAVPEVEGSTSFSHDGFRAVFSSLGRPELSSVSLVVQGASLKWGGVLTQDACDLVSRLSHVRTLDLRVCATMQDLFPCLACLPVLEQLTLDVVPRWSAWVPLFQGAFPKLRHLDIREEHAGGRLPLEDIMHALSSPHFSNLRCFDTLHWQHNCPSWIRVIAEKWPQTFVSLRLRVNGFEHGVVAGERNYFPAYLGRVQYVPLHMFRTLDACKGLRELEMFSTGFEIVLTDTDMDNFGHICSRLEVLRIVDHPAYPDRSLYQPLLTRQTLWVMSEYWLALRELALSVDFSKPVESMQYPSRSNLTRFDAGHSYIPDAGAAVSFIALRFPRLQHFSHKNDHVMRAIREGLQLPSAPV